MVSTGLGGRRGLVRGALPGQRGRVLAARRARRDPAGHVGHCRCAPRARFPAAASAGLVDLDGVDARPRSRSLLQAPLDVLVERGPTAALVGLAALQLGWAVLVLGACRLVQRRAERRLVVQGG